MRRLLLFFLVLHAIMTSRARADSGGPYFFLANPTAAQREALPPINPIVDASAQPLQFYTEHIPEPVWNESKGEPTGFKWSELVPSDNTTVVVELLGRAHDREVYSITPGTVSPPENISFDRVEPQAVTLVVKSAGDGYVPRLVLCPGGSGPQDIKFSSVLNDKWGPYVVLHTEYGKDDVQEVVFLRKDGALLANPWKAWEKSGDLLKDLGFDDLHPKQRLFSPFSFELFGLGDREGGGVPESGVVIPLVLKGDQFETGKPKAITMEEYQYRAEDYGLNRTYQALRRKLSPDELRELVSEQREWIKSRDETCSNQDGAKRWECIRDQTSRREEELVKRLPPGTSW